MVPTGSFVPRETFLETLPLTDARRANSFSLCALGDPQIMQYSPGLSPAAGQCPGALFQPDL